MQQMESFVSMSRIIKYYATDQLVQRGLAAIFDNMTMPPGAEGLTQELTVRLALCSF